MEYIKIIAWEKFQHYKKRSPPWVKLHTSLLDNDDFECMTDASKLLLICLWMYTARKGNGKVTTDIRQLQRKLPVTGEIDLQPLIDKGFIELLSDCKHNASEVLVLDRDRDRDRVESEGEGEGKKTPPPTEPEEAWNKSEFPPDTPELPAVTNPELIEVLEAWAAQIGVNVIERVSAKHRDTWATALAVHGKAWCLEAMKKHKSVHAGVCVVGAEDDLTVRGEPTVDDEHIAKIMRIATGGKPQNN